MCVQALATLDNCTSVIDQGLPAFHIWKSRHQNLTLHGRLPPDYRKTSASIFNPFIGRHLLKSVATAPETVQPYDHCGTPRLASARLHGFAEPARAASYHLAIPTRSESKELGILLGISIKHPCLFLR